ncbi:MAG: OmpA family protein [Cyclobacteriaceae bacterium]
MKKGFVFLWLLILAIGCNPLKKAEKSFAREEFSTVIDHYKGSVKPGDAEVNYILAEAYRRSNQIEESTPYYEAAIKAGIDKEIANYFYAKSLQANGQYDKAAQVLDSYVQRGQDEEALAAANSEIRNLARIDEVKEKPNYFRVKNLEAINTPQAEYSAVYNQGEIYFTSNRKSNRIYKGTGTGFTDIYKVKSRGAVVDMSSLKALEPLINDPSVNEGSVTFSSDGTLMIYAKGNSGKSSGTENVDLYFARYRNGKWFTPRMLSINDDEFWDSCPSLTADGKTLYFASNRPGGYGGTDIYSAKLNRRGRWVDVRNAGPQINTVGNEMFPHVDENGTLYFSSDGHPGLGRLDIFTARRESGVITIENPGAPINSTGDDFAMYMYDPVRGFLSSNREGGMGDDDIYTFVNDDPDLKLVNYFLTGVTFTTDETGAQVPLASTKVMLLDDEDNMVDEVFTGTDGAYKFRVYTEEDYYLIGEKADYFTTRTGFSTVGKSVDKSTLTEMVTDITFEKDLVLQQIVLEKPIALDNIYYDLDKSDIREDAARELDKLVTTMKDNPEISIELSSHTDARADNDYNMNLSQRRAQSAVNYIVSQGIEQGRLVARGYGETRLIIANAETEDEHQVNRRTEFKVIRYDRRSEEDSDYLDEDRFFINSGDEDINDPGRGGM